MTKFKFYQDPGHGWVKVPKALLKELGIDEKISSYSYMRGDFVYLEEDMDLGTFMDAMKAADRSVSFDEFHTNRESKLRGYDAYLKTWNTAELQAEFTVVAFSAPYVDVIRKRDGKKGSLMFNHIPRYYFIFFGGLK